MLVGIQKSLQINKVIWVRSAPFPVRKTVAKTSPAWKTKDPCWAGITVNYEMGAKLFKTETLRQIP